MQEASKEKWDLLDALLAEKFPDAVLRNLVFTDVVRAALVARGLFHAGAIKGAKFEDISGFPCDAGVAGTLKEAFTGDAQAGASAGIDAGGAAATAAPHSAVLWIFVCTALCMSLTQLADTSEEFANELFAPFTKAAFPTQLELQSLSSLLNLPPVKQIPVPAVYMNPASNLWLDDTHPLFRAATATESAFRLSTKLCNALTISWRTGISSELGHTSYWDNMGGDLPEYAAGLLGFSAVVQRDVTDNTISVAKKKRDYMVLLDGQLCVGGEDKTNKCDFQMAVNECSKKHNGANAAVYGRLGYILLVVKAGGDFGVYALPVNAAADMSPQVVLQKFSVNHVHVVTQTGRRRALRTFINITRWVRTIHELNLLPPKPVLPLLTTVDRPSPYTGTCHSSSEMCGWTQMTMHLRSVVKEMSTPTERVPLLLEVYRMLSLAMPQTGQTVPHTARCIKMDPQPAMQTVRLQLEPVAVRWVVHTAKDLQSMCADVLQALCAVHDRGFVHRDVRQDNILLADTGYVLIDWELAARVGDTVFWDPKPEHVPPTVRRDTSWQPWMDVWQLGRVIHALQPSRHAGSARADFVDRLCTANAERRFPSARVALQNVHLAEW
ncbi:hypothetical protein JKP88DRAFT_265861 [Tribonema minus]|uniref:Protein kinase domain-containing protein n=1 Tax=Tribonema minus TaxID=303371 RepID=A0A835YH77_9STRA|nr:hypothetical protein JKP88DRAFT_265861 [Tribonema minus]